MRPLLGIALLASLAACAGVDSRHLPFQAPLARMSLGEQTVVVGGRRYVLRAYAETRAGMGPVTALYVVGADRGRPLGRAGDGTPVYVGTVEGRPFFSNTPGEWYCGQTTYGCIFALEPEQIPRFARP